MRWSATARRSIPGCSVRASVGHYLGQPFEATILGVQAVTAQPGRYRLTLDLRRAVDVVTFDSFSAFRKRVHCTIDETGRTIEKTSNGRPQVELAVVMTAFRSFSRNALSTRRDAVAALQTFRQAEFFQLADFLLEGRLFKADRLGDLASRDAVARGDQPQRLECPGDVCRRRRSSAPQVFAFGWFKVA